MTEQSNALEALEEIESTLNMCVAKDCEKENITTIKQALTQQGWQPIETAPKDGTIIRLWDGNRQCDGWWIVDHNDEFRNNPQPSWYDTHGDDFSCGSYYCPIDPTHWQPLPKTPTQGDSE